MALRQSLIDVDLVLSERLNSESLAEADDRIQRTLLRSITPNAELRFRRKSCRKERECLLLGVLSWYLSRESQILIQSELLQLKLTRKNLLRLRVILASKKSMLSWIATFSMRIVCGSIVKDINELLSKTFFFVKFPRTARRLVRRRGYRDKGSCRPESSWLPDSDFYLTELMNEIEAEKANLEKILLSIKKFGPLGVRLLEFE